jgi:hypothetical protein
MANQILATYSFEDVQCSIRGPGGGFPLGAGSANSEEGITVTMDEEKNKKDVGADGAGMNTLRASDAGSISLSLLKTSPVNAQLSQLYNFQKQSSGTWGQNVMTIRNPVTGDEATCQGVAFKKLPDRTDSKDPKMNTWTFDAISIDQDLASLLD